MFEHCVKTCLFCRARVQSPTVSNRFALDTFGLSKKKGVARKCYEMFFLKNKAGQRTQKQDGTQQTIFFCMSGKALSAHALTLKKWKRL